MGMRLRFGPGTDEGVFHQVADDLLAELDGWADEPGSGVPPDDTLDAGLLLDWRFGHSTGDLDRFDAADFEEYLLRWCPARVSAPAEEWPGIVAGARAWLLFLVSTGRWAGGSVRPLLRALDRLQPRFVQQMAERAERGPVTAGARAGRADVDLDDPESLRAAVDALNDLSSEERARLTDAFFVDPDDDLLGLDLLDPDVPDDLPDGPLAVELPLTPPPDPQLAAQEAARSPVVRQFDAARRHLGRGVTLTAKGNPKLVDARALVAALGTDDVADRVIRGREHKLHSADQLPHLRFLLQIAEDVGAVRRQRGKLIPVQEWAGSDPVERVRACFAAMLDAGPLAGRYAGGRALFDDLDQLCEDGLLPWMAVVFAVGAVDVDALTTEVLRVAGPTLGDGFRLDRPDLVRKLLTRRMADVFDVVERCGLVTWTGHRTEDDHGHPLRTGGALRLTELGRLLLPEFLSAAGYRPDNGDALAGLAADELVARLLGGGPEPDAVWAAWRPDQPDTDKAAAVVTAFAQAATAEERLVALGLLAAAPEAAAPHLLAIGDGPLAGHVALFLSGHGLADGSRLDDLAPEVGLLPVVDVLASTMDDGPEEVVAYFDHAIPPEGRRDVLSVLGRVSTAETAAVLDVLGRHHADPATAKAARKAAMQHRSRALNAG